MIYNIKEKTDSIMGIKVVDRIKYLGIEIDGKKNYFKTQREKVIQKARMMANLTYSVIEKSCNKLLIGKTYWKSIALPNILYGTSVINFTEENIKELQRIENSVYRTILGAAHYVSNTTLRGDIGASTVKKRIINSRLNYIISIEKQRNQLLENILTRIQIAKDTKWIKTTMKYMNETNLHFGHMRTLTKIDLKRVLNVWDKEMWTEELYTKSSLKIY